MGRTVLTANSFESDTHHKYTDKYLFIKIYLLVYLEIAGDEFD